MRPNAILLLGILVVGCSGSTAATHHAAPHRPAPTYSQSQVIDSAEATTNPVIADPGRAAMALRRHHPGDLPRGESTTVLEFVVDVDSLAKEIVVVESSGVRRIDDAAIRVAEHLIFRPGQVNGRDVPVRVRWPMSWHGGR